MGYLDAYGVADQRREKIVKRTFLWGGSALVIVVVAYFSLRTYGQQRVMNQFLSEIQHQQYADAYRMWGCPEQCKFYSMDKFMEDWGPSGEFAKTTNWKVQHVDYCDDGVNFDLNLPDDAGLWVNRSTNIISFSGFGSRCPGRHLQLGAFFKSLFS